MAYSARILLDSVAPHGKRITTMEVSFPRFILAEMNTHRRFSRSYASSRAIPVEKRIEMVVNDPVVPEGWGKNRRGMQATEQIDDAQGALMAWLKARDEAVKYASELASYGLHKQLANRLLEPFTYVTGIITSTEWDNFFHLRCHPDAQPEMQRIAEMMRDAYFASTPQLVGYGRWHVPLVDFPGSPNMDLTTEEALACSAARCARVSYNNHDGSRPDPSKDLELAARLQASGHMSPFEHQGAPAAGAHVKNGNLIGWLQYRMILPNPERLNYQPPEKADAST